MPKTPTHDQGYICYGRGVGMATGEINEKRRYIGEKLKNGEEKSLKNALEHRFKINAKSSDSPSKHYTVQEISNHASLQRIRNAAHAQQFHAKGARGQDP